jgi:hypothetical protein
MVPFVAFHVEHIVPRKHGGGDGDDNLALSCFHCNFHKGTNLTGFDPDSGLVALLFHPRREVWDEHFFPEGAMIMGHTPRGRATVRVLDMNAPSRIELRLELMGR